jgi:bisphosphoglycerate-independent phosphoglycerate mutase (AlkP superfamily)
MGLLSPCGVHGHEEQIMAMVELAANRGLTSEYLSNSGVEQPAEMAGRSLINAAWVVNERKAGFLFFAGCIGQ